MIQNFILCEFVVFWEFETIKVLFSPKIYKNKTNKICKYKVFDVESMYFEIYFVFQSKKFGSQLLQNLFQFQN